MTRRRFDATINHVASRLAAEHRTLAKAWLERLEALLDVDRGQVFPTPQLLDHSPDLLRVIAAYLRAPADEEIGANTAVMQKAAELGLLRFDQQASVHQLLREYQHLSEILEAFFAREAAGFAEETDTTAALLALARAQRAVRELQRKTVDAFIARYTETIEQQHGQLRSFGRLVSHEIRQPLGVLQVLTRLMQTDDEPGRQRLVVTLERNVVRLAEVAGKLERLARLTRRAEVAPNGQTVDMAAVARDVATQLADMADVRGVTFDIPDDLASLAADAGRVELVLINLLANGVSTATPPSRRGWSASGTAPATASSSSSSRTTGSAFPRPSARSSSSSSCGRTRTGTTSSAPRAWDWGFRSCANAWTRWAARSAWNRRRASARRSS
ncbi:MAG: HAMP domain-containing sensor histidine kinase [Vicinamibacterales bacterium]